MGPLQFREEERKWPREHNGGGTRGGGAGCFFFSFFSRANGSRHFCGITAISWRLLSVSYGWRELLFPNVIYLFISLLYLVIAFYFQMYFIPFYLFIFCICSTINLIIYLFLVYSISLYLFIYLYFHPSIHPSFHYLYIICTPLNPLQGRGGVFIFHFAVFCYLKMCFIYFSF